jgi:hypothetical protein
LILLPIPQIKDYLYKEMIIPEGIKIPSSVSFNSSLFKEETLSQVRIIDTCLSKFMLPLPS